MAIIPTQNQYPDRTGYLGLDTDRNVLSVMSDGKMNSTSIPEGWVNVKDFGAKGDGITDDSLAIQAAIDSINTGTIFFPKGEYITTKSINITKGCIKLIGCGVANTIIHKTADSNDGLNGLNTIISIGNEDTNPVFFNGIEDITLYGSVPNNYDPINYTVIGLYAVRIYNAFFKNIHIDHTNIGVQLNETVMSSYQNIMVLYSAYGFKINGTSSIFMNCYVQGPQGTFLRIGYDINGLGRSSMISCATDNGTGIAYKISNSTIVMDNCGLEKWGLDRKDFGLIYIINSYIVINNLRIHYAFTSNTNYGYLLRAGSVSRLILNNFYITDITGFFKWILLTSIDYAIINAPNIPKEQIILGSSGTTIFNNMYGYQANPFTEQEFYSKLYSPTKQWKIKVDDTGTLSTEEII